MEEQFSTPAGAVDKVGLMKLLFKFEGRVGRKECWVWFGACILANVTFELLGDVVGGMLALLLLIPTIWISLAIYIKRFHDLDKSGWLTLLLLIPFVNLLVLIGWLGCVKGTEGPNRFGLPGSGGKVPF